MNSISGFEPNKYVSIRNLCRWHVILGCGLATLLFVFLAWACSDPDSKLRVGTNIWPGYEPLYLAREKGYFTPKRINLVEYQSASEVLRAFRNHSIDAAALTLDEALLLADNDFRIRIILVLDISAGGDVILARPGIPNVRSLRGKKVAVESTATGSYLLFRALEIHNLEAKQLHIQHLEVSEHFQAYQRHEIDAAVTFDPIKTRLEKQGARVIFDSSQIPNEIVDVLVVHSNSLVKQRANLEDLVWAWFKALWFLQAKPREAATIMAQRQQIDADDFLATLDGLEIPGYRKNLELIGDSRKGLQPITIHIERVLQKTGRISDDLKTHSLFDDSILQRLNEKEINEFGTANGS